MDGDQDLNLHLQLVEARAQVQVCVRYEPDMASDFAARMGKWTSFHAEALARGAELAERKGFNKPPTPVQKFAEFEAQVLESLPADDRKRRCKELLDGLALPAQK